MHSKVSDKFIKQLQDSMPDAKGYFEVSSKTGEGVVELFAEIAKQENAKYHALRKSMPIERSSVNLAQVEEKKEKCCK